VSPFAPTRAPVNPACITAAFLIVSALFLGACASTAVTVDSLAKPNAEDAVSYRLENKNPLIDDDSLRYREAADYVRAVLSGKGMYEAPPNVIPDMVVGLDYGIGPPEAKLVRVLEPIFVEVPGRVRTETRHIGTDPATGRPILALVTVVDPATTEYAGEREYEVSKIVYEKYVRIAARENKEAVEGRPRSEIWTVDVTSEGESRDLRKNLPVLIAATIDYIGKDSQGQKKIQLKDTDTDVVFVKKGMPANKVE
jgi:hypothetical protein